LRQPGVSEAINALRVELAEIGRLLNDAMPRHAIEAIEAQIQGLAQRVAEGRQAGFDSDALARIEYGLAEVRDSLRGLTPAENLVGYHEAVAGLAEKIDLIVAQRDPAAMQQLQNSITSLREMASHVASNETVSRLAAEVQQLAENVEHIAKSSAGGDALFHIEHRLAALSEALAERAQKDGGISPRLEALIESLLEKVEQLQMQPAMAPEMQHAVATLLDMADHAVSSETVNQLTAEVHQLVANVEHIVRNGATGDALLNIEHRLAALSESLEHAQGAAQWPQVEMLLQSLHEKVEQLQHAPGDQAALSHLDSSIVQLAEKLDAIGSRFAQLDAIEHGIADLLMQVEEMRTARDNPQASADNVEHDIARTQDALEAMHETLGHVVDRLAMIEQDIRDGKRALVPAYGGMAASHQTVGNLAVRIDPELAPLVPASALAVQPPTSVAAPDPVASPAPQAASDEPAEEPDLSPDRPLEPGSGQPNTPAGRVAASEAALGSAKPAAASDPNSKSNFIAAARRAAQAASQDQNSRSTRGQSGGPDAGDDSSLRSRLMHRVKTLFIAASVIAIVIGSVQTASKFNWFGLGNAPADKVAKAPASGLEQSADDQHSDDPLATGSTKPAADQTAPGHSDAAPQISPPTATATPSAGLILPGASGGLPSLLSAPGASPAFDITGSIPRAHNSAKTPPATSAPAVGELPTALGGERLRSAAVAGDAAAAYEVGLRYAEGRGVPVDFEQAALWFKRAADKGLVPAQFRLASLLEKGKGVPKNPEGARQLYLAAANKGSAKAMHNLAVLYAEGIDGKSDYSAAVKWFRMASERGLADSQFNLGVLAARGIGMTIDLSEAYKWFALAAKQGDKEAGKKRDEIAEQLDPGKLAAAKHAVDNFVAKPQPAEAVNVPAPAGGWDSAAASQPAKKTRQSATYKVSKH
jgi:localization factor PodJL